MTDIYFYHHFVICMYCYHKVLFIPFRYCLWMIWQQEKHVYYHNLGNNFLYLYLRNIDVYLMKQPSRLLVLITSWSTPWPGNIHFFKWCNHPPPSPIVFYTLGTMVQSDFHPLHGVGSEIDIESWQSIKEMHRPENHENHACQISWHAWFSWFSGLCISLMLLKMGLHLKSRKYKGAKESIFHPLTYLPLVPHIVNRVSIGSDNGLLPIRRQAII